MTHDITPMSDRAGIADADTLVLLQSVVDVARAIFGAAASSVFLLDVRAGELVFQAVSGKGEEFLVGTRFPADRGIAGWVASSGQSMVVDDRASNPSFARDLAESTRYVPQALMAAPLIYDGEVLGVLEVLDPASQCRSNLSEFDLLDLFAGQAAIALRVAFAHRACPVEPSNGALPARAADEREAHLVDAFRDFLRQLRPS